jgi:hypothetical protein
VRAEKTPLLIGAICDLRAVEARATDYDRRRGARDGRSPRLSRPLDRKSSSRLDGDDIRDLETGLAVTGSR